MSLLRSRTFIVEAKSNLNSTDSENVIVKFYQKIWNYYSQLDKDNNLIDTIQIKRDELNSELVKDFDRLAYNTNKEQVRMLRESFKNCNVSKLVDEWWETNLPIYLEKFLSNNERILRRWYDYLDLTNPLKQRFKSYEEFRKALSSDVGTDEWVLLAKESLNSLLISPEGNLSTTIQKFMSDNNKLMNKILEFFNLINLNHENNLSESLSNFDNLLTKVSKIQHNLTVSTDENGRFKKFQTKVEQVEVDLNDIGSASDVKDILSNFITEMFVNMLQDSLTYLDTQSRDVINSTIKPKWDDDTGVKVVEIDLQVLWHDRELLKAIENSIKENKVISGEWGWLQQEHYNYNLPTRKQWADNYVSSWEELMLNETADTIEHGLDLLNQLVSMCEKSYNFFVEKTQMSSEQINFLKNVLLEVSTSNQGSLVIVAIIFFLITIRTIGKRLIRDYLLFKQVPWATFFKVIGGLFLFSGSTLVMGKWKGGSNFILKVVSVYFGFDDMVISLMNDVTGLDVETAWRTIECFFGGLSMVIGFILVLFSRSEKKLANDIRFIKQGMNRLPGFGLVDTFKRSKLIEKHEETIDSLEPTSEGREEVIDAKLETISKMDERIEVDEELDSYEKKTESIYTMSEEELDEFLKENDKYIVSRKKKVRELALECWSLKERGDVINSKKKLDEVLWEIYGIAFAQHHIDKVKEGSQTSLFP